MRLKPASLTVALFTVGALALGLTACAPQGEPTEPTETPSTAPGATAECTPAGPASDSVEVTGDFGGELSIDVGDGISVSGIERTVAIPGSTDTGAVLGQTVNAYYAVFDGTTGEVLERGSDLSPDPAPFLNYEGVYTEGIFSALNCATPDSRVVTAMSAGDAFGPNAAQLGLVEATPIVLVLDVASVEDTELPEEPTAATVLRDGSLSAPAIDLTSDDMPNVTLPEAAPPAEYQLEVLVPGDGEIVPAGATVEVDYHGVSWDTAEIFDSSYLRGTSASFPTDGVIDGFRDALVGQPVGSTVVATIPPALAYGEDPTAHRLGGQTLVFVVHIIAVS